MHGWGIAQRIQQVSRDVLRVNQGSLYPALYRLESEGWIAAEWGASENNRKAKYYRLTRAGRAAARRRRPRTGSGSPRAIDRDPARPREEGGVMRLLSQASARSEPCSPGRERRAEMDDELRFHLELETADNVSRGHAARRRRAPPPSHVRRRRSGQGGVPRARAAGACSRTLVQDVALRRCAACAAAPGFTAARRPHAGARHRRQHRRSSAVVNGVLLRPSPYAQRRARWWSCASRTAARRASRTSASRPWRCATTAPQPRASTTSSSTTP